MSFIDVLNDERGHELVDQIEELIGETDKELVRIRENLIADLKNEFGYEYTI